MASLNRGRCFTTSAGWSRIAVCWTAPLGPKDAVPIAMTMRTREVRMQSTISVSDMHPAIRRAAVRVAGSAAGQAVVRVGDTACRIDWAPDAHYHRSLLLLLPLLLLTAALDREAAAIRWSAVTFVQAVGAAHRLDHDQKEVLRALGQASLEPSAEGVSANGETVPTCQAHDGFARQAVSWIDRFGLDGRVVQVDKGRLAGGGEDAHHGVRPLWPSSELPKVLRQLAPGQRLAAVALLALHNPAATQDALKGRGRPALNPAAVQSFAGLREAGDGAYPHQLRLLATYRGW